ncbi:MAG: carboxymuconolactone decarboxylase family protein [Caldilineaceae bacterium]|nr:carboxymuconolactone decarboxylase family protein [Caldilineaceae bacterium]
MHEDDYQRGVEQFAKMVGEARIDELRARFASLSPDFERAVMGVVGGEIWARPNLDLRTRSLCSIAALAALGRVNALDLNIEMALNNGATVDEIVEVFFQVAAYGGLRGSLGWTGEDERRRRPSSTGNRRR